MASESEKLSQYIDINGADGAYTFNDIQSVCEFTQKYECRSVTVAPCYINTCFKFLKGHPEIIKKSQIGAPYGSDMTSVKVYAAKQAEIIGAQTVEVAMNVGAFMSGNLKYVKHELETVTSNLEGLFAVVIESDFMDIEQTGQAADLAASITPFVKINGSLGGKNDFILKTQRAFELSKGCIQITSGCRDVSPADLSELKKAGAEYFSVDLTDARKLFEKDGAATDGKSTKPD